MKKTLLLFLCSTLFFALKSQESPKEYIQYILKIIKEGDYKNHWNNRILSQEIYKYDTIKGQSKSIMTFQYSGYDIINSSDNIFTIKFISEDRPYEVPSKWDIERTFEILETSTGYKLKAFPIYSGGGFTQIYFYQFKEIPIIPDTNTDFSNIFLEEELKKVYFEKMNESKNELTKENFCNIFMKVSENIEGSIGGYSRLQLHFDTIEKIGPLTYKVNGKIKTLGNIFDFAGTIEIVKVRSYPSVYIDENEKIGDSIIQGIALSEVNFFQDSIFQSAGSFHGIMSSYWYKTLSDNKIHLDEMDYYSDSYRNNTFVGIWKSYHSNTTLKAVWGQRELPYTEDLDIAAGGTYINDRYRKNGWDVNIKNWWK